MSKSLRLSEKWFRRGLWLVALVFANFLIGLGSTIVGDLPKMETRRTVSDFLSPPARQLETSIQDNQTELRKLADALEQERLAWSRARADSLASHQTFQNWLATRTATQQSAQDPEVIARTRALDKLKQQERTAQQAMEATQQRQLTLQQSTSALQRQLEPLQESARHEYQKDYRSLELRVFLYRLLLTLPLLVAAGWLFAKKRTSSYWPFVWGFIFFAVVAFFVELVPYLPSYGGYVRYIVGIVVTFFVGRYAIQALQRYLERQQQTEALPDQTRRRELDYDTALQRLSKSVCPGCERPLNLNDPSTDFCAHCGINVFHACGTCTTRRNSFSRYCHHCGSSNETSSSKHSAAGGSKEVNV